MPGDQEAVTVSVGRATTALNQGPAGAAPTDPDRVTAARSMPMPGTFLTPPIDIYEGPEGLVLEADFPGVPEDLLSIQLEDNVLSLYGKVSPPTWTGAKLLHGEYQPGDFCRSFILSDEVDRARITASLKNGVLRVTLPKAERRRTRRIEIKTS